MAFATWFERRGRAMGIPCAMYTQQCASLASKDVVGTNPVLVEPYAFCGPSFLFWSKTGGEFGQRRRSAGAAEGTELLQALFVQLSAAADAVLSSPLGWPTRYSHIYRLEKRRAE